MNVYGLIPVGPDNAILKSQLLELTGMTDRALRRAVAAERMRGRVILTDCSGTGGYYRPTNTDQTVKFIRSMRRRAKETSAIADATEAALLTETGQEQMGGWIL